LKSDLLTGKVSWDFPLANSNTQAKQFSLLRSLEHKKLISEP